MLSLQANFSFTFQALICKNAVTLISAEKKKDVLIRDSRRHKIILHNLGKWPKYRASSPFFPRNPRSGCSRLITAGDDPKSAHNYGSTDTRRRWCNDHGRSPRTPRRIHPHSRADTHTYDCIHSRRHFTHQHHETYTAEGMKTAVVPSVHTRRDTISSSRRRWRYSGGCSRVTAGSFTGIVARHELPSP